MVVLQAEQQLLIVLLQVEQQKSIVVLQEGSKVLVQPQVKAAKVYLGSSTVLAAVVIAVKYRACLLVGRLIVGVQARSFSWQIAGVSARQPQTLAVLFFICETAILAKLGPYLNSHLYLLDNDILERAYGEQYLRGMQIRTQCIKIVDNLANV